MSRRVLREEPVHLTFALGDSSYARRKGIRSYRIKQRPGDRQQLHGVSVSSPARTWTELTSILSLTDLVIAGDYLLKLPWHLNGRRSSLSSVEALTQQVRHLRGGTRDHATRALKLIRQGADSPRETKFRLALLRAGLPEPILQYPLDSADPYSWSLDAAYPQQRLGFQYDGGHHFTGERALQDQRRDNAFTAAGWRVLKLNLLDDRDDFRSSILQIRHLLQLPT